MCNGDNVKIKRTRNQEAIASALNFTSLTSEQSERIYNTLFEELRKDVKAVKKPVVLKLIEGGKR